MGDEPGREAGKGIWRPLTAEELALVDEALVGEWADADSLRTQLEHLRARPGCLCGCGTLDLKAPSGEAALGASSPTSREGVVLDADGAEVGGLLLFLTDGRLASLEVYSYGAPLALPAPGRVNWQTIDRTSPSP